MQYWLLLTRGNVFWAHLRTTIAWQCKWIIARGVPVITTNYLCDFSHTLIIPMSTLTMLEKYSTQAAFISRGLVPLMLRPAHYLQTMISHTMIDPSSVACNSQVALLPAPQSQSWNLSPLMVQQSTAYGYSANWAWLCTRRVLKLRFQSSLLFPINHLPPICQCTYIWSSSQYPQESKLRLFSLKTSGEITLRVREGRNIL